MTKTHMRFYLETNEREQLGRNRGILYMTL